MCICYSGDLARTDEVLAPIRALGEPVFDFPGHAVHEVQSYLDETEPKGMHYYWRTGYVAELADELLPVRDVFADCPIPGAELGFLHLEGALNEHPEDDGAVGNRDARYIMGVNGMWEPDEPARTSHEQWIRARWERTCPSRPAATTSTS